MDNVLLKYMNTRYDEFSNKSETIGPVITISREFGCYATEIAEKLAQKINEEKQDTQWYCVTKEILEDAAEDLKVKPEQISHIFGAKEKGIWRDVLDTFSGYKTVSDSTIKRTISEVVLSYAQTGKSIIVGRAGCIIAKDVEKSLHIKLMAPYSWRIQQISDRHKLAENEAGEYIKENDKYRQSFMSFFKGNKSDNEIFDAIFNRSTLTTDQIVATIYSLAESRNLV